MAVNSAALAKRRGRLVFFNRRLLCDYESESTAATVARGRTSGIH
jgi:hypothetical protein